MKKMADVPEQEFQAVLRLPAEERYARFIKRVAALEEVWTLGDEEGYVTYTDESGRIYYAFWPHAAYAAHFATGEWARFTPKAVDLYYWLDKWLSGMQADNVGLVIFPNGEDELFVDPEQLGDLRGDVEAELERY